MDDLISRRLAMKTALEFFIEYYGGAFREDEQRLLAERIDALPSAQPEIKTGRWIKPTGMMPPEHHGHYECSECGAWAMRPWLKP